MINEPICVVGENFQEVWLEVVRQLKNSGWELRNLIVHIKNPSILNQVFHDKIRVFAERQGILDPKHVAYTIFPHRLYQKRGNATSLFMAYNRPRGFYERKKTRWGTYFRRMTNYESVNGAVNQLGNIITAIQNRGHLSKAAYTIVIQNPGGETVSKMGGPCLNYIAIQADSGQRGQRPTIGLLAVYRNHDFLKRAYGNYWGLCNLLTFLANEVNGLVGPITCVSSHAYIDGKKNAISTLVKKL